MIETPLEICIDHYELEFDDQFVCLDGEPFTGLVVSRYPNGQLESASR